VSPGRPHLAVALICAITVACLLATALRQEARPESPWEVTPPHLYDQPFRGAPLGTPPAK
jgi:hypothetical protein